MRTFIVLFFVVLCAIGFGVAIKITNEEQKTNRLHKHQYNLALKKVSKIQEEKKEEQSRLRELSAQFPGMPVAGANATEHDFGIMDPHTKGEHQFVIKNEGKGVLELKKNGKTCHCVGFELDKNIVLPGESATVSVRWDTRLPTDEFRHGATVATNDPDYPKVKFRVNGVVRIELGASPPAFHFSRIVPGTSQTKRLIILSEVWDDFEIIEPKLTMKGATFTIEKATAQELAENSSSSTSVAVSGEAKCGYAVEVTTPQDLESGSFSNKWFQAKVIPEGDSSKTRGLEIEINGHVIRRLGVYEKSIPVRDIKLGDIKSALGIQKRYVVRAFDENPQLKLRTIKTTPEFAQVEFHPLSEGTSGVYALKLTIPKGSSGVYQGEKAGSINLEFDHPRIKQLSIPLTFNVLSRSSFAQKVSSPSIDN